MKFCCWKNYDLTRAVAKVIRHENSNFIKYVILRILRDYAAQTTNTIDNDLVDEVERRLGFVVNDSPKREVKVDDDVEGFFDVEGLV